MIRVPVTRSACACIVLAITAGCADTPASPLAPTVAFSSGRQVSGRVYDERAARGVAGLTLAWTPSDSASVATTVTDETGVYVVLLPPAESYSVTGGTVISPAIVRANGALDLVNFYVNTGGCPTQYGRLVDAVTDRPVANAHITWAGVDAASDVTGAYRLTLVCRPGGYGSNTTTVSVSHPDYEFYWTVGGRAEDLGLTPGEFRRDIALTPR